MVLSYWPAIGFSFFSLGSRVSKVLRNGSFAGWEPRDSTLSGSREREVWGRVRHPPRPLSLACQLLYQEASLVMRFDGSCDGARGSPVVGEGRCNMKAKTFLFCLCFVSLVGRIYGGTVVSGGERAVTATPMNIGEFGVLTWCAAAIVGLGWLFPKLLNK